MCDYDEFIFTCGHSVFRLKCYCHYARNQPDHHCRKVKKLRSCWDQSVECEACQEERRKREEEAAQQAAYYQYIQSQGGNGSQ